MLYGNWACAQLRSLKHLNCGHKNPNRQFHKMGTNPPNIYCILHEHGLALCFVQTDGRKQNQNQQCAKMCFKDPMKSKPIAGGFFVQRIGKV
jgi:hypothetical protein